MRVSLEGLMWLWMDSGYITARRTKYEISREACVANHYRQCFWPLLQFIGTESAQKSLWVGARQTIRSVAYPALPRSRFHTHASSTGDRSRSPCLNTSS